MKKLKLILPTVLVVIGVGGSFYISQTLQTKDVAPEDSSATQKVESYPIGAYFSTNESDLSTLSSLGFNLVFAPLVDEYNELNINSTKTFLQKAKENGLGVIINVFLPLQHPTTLEGLKTYVQAIKNEEALYGYYLMDEPELYEFATLERVKNLNAFVKTIDNKHPTILVFSAQFDKASPYFGTADIEGFNLYPFRNSVTTANAINEYTAKVQEYKSLNSANSITKAYFQVLQAYGDQAGNTRLPTIDEIQAQYFAGIASFPYYQGVLYFAWDFSGVSSDLKRSSYLHESISLFNNNIVTNNSYFPVTVSTFETSMSSTQNTSIFSTSKSSSAQTSSVRDINSASTTNKTTQVVSICAALDIDNNKTISIVEIALFAEYYGKSCRGECDRFDTNNDDIIDEIDLNNLKSCL